MSWLDKCRELIVGQRQGESSPLKPKTVSSEAQPKEDTADTEIKQQSGRFKSARRQLWEHSLDSISNPRPEVKKEPETTPGLRSPGPTTVWYDLWLKELAKYVQPKLTAPPPPFDAELANQATERMMVTIFDALNNLASEFNAIAGIQTHKVSVTEPKHAPPYYRFRLSTATYSLSVRGRTGVIEFFHLPTSELMKLLENENSGRLRASLHLNMESSPSFWTINGFPLDLHESRVLLRNVFKELITRTTNEYRTTGQRQPDLSADKMNQILHEMAIEKQNLVQKIVIQQEDIQKRIARDLHDTVISDVMMLKRSFNESTAIDKDKLVKTLDGIHDKLREICHDLAPRDLVDWGLQPVVEDLLQRVADETGADCSFNCDCQIPDLPESVQLHIFRIIQECLNNTVKYAEATRIQVNVERRGAELTFIVEDNGKGFTEGDEDEKSDKQGGFGLGGMRERVDMIRCFYPTRLTVESQAGIGTKTALQLAVE